MEHNRKNFVNQKITHRKPNIQALQESNAKLEFLFDLLPVGIFVLNQERRVVKTNHALEKLLNIDIEDLLSKRIHNRRHFRIDGTPLPIEEYPDLQIFNNEKQGLHIETGIEKEDGEIVWVDISAIDCNFSDWRTIIIVSDITDRVRGEKETKKQFQRAELLLRTSTQFNARLDLDLLLHTICRESTSALDMIASSVHMYDPQQNEFILSANDGFSPETYAHHVTVPYDDYEGLFPQPEPAVMITDARAIPNLVNASLLTLKNIRTMMVAKIQFDGKLLGILSVFSRISTRHFEKDDLLLLQTLANQAAQAINNARLFEQVSASQKRLNDLSQALIETQEKERRTLALELHDELGQVLSSMKLSLDVISPGINPPERAQFERALALNKNLIDQVRRLSLELRPGMLDSAGLLAALKWLFNNYRSQTGEIVHFTSSGLEKRFPPMLEISAYRIIQEALTNIVRHAENKQVFVDIWTDERFLNLQVVDHGIGFDLTNLANKPTSSGLSGIRERALLLGGEATLESAPGAGTTISARLPVIFG